MSKAVGQRWRAEQGFSLTEMLVVLSIMGVVLAGAYALGLVTTRAAETAEIQSAFTAEVGTPLQLSEKYLQQNTGLEVWEDYRLVCFTDTDIDGFSERITIEAHADGRLTLTAWNTDVQRVNTTERLNFTMSENNANVANGTPLFVYVDEDGNEVTTFDSRASDTRIIMMEVDADFDGTELSDTREVYFRNR